MEISLYILLVVAVIIVVMQFLQLRRSSVDLSPLVARIEALQNAQERTDRALRDELARSRAEGQTAGPAGKNGAFRITESFR